MAVLVSGVVVLFFYSSISATGIKTIISDYVRKNLELTIELYEGMGMSPESVRMFSESLEKIHFVIV